MRLKNRKIDIRYIAGFFDADGNLHMHYSESKRFAKCSAKIVNTDKEILKKIKNFFGFGSLSKRNWKGIPKHHKQTYQYEIQNFGEIKKFLKKITPYLILKKERAEIMYVIVNRKPKSPYTDTEFKLIKKMKKLNTRGVGSQEGAVKIQLINKLSKMIDGA